jgi:ankyrin repeat protein
MALNEAFLALDNLPLLMEELRETQWFSKAKEIEAIARQKLELQIVNLEENDTGVFQEPIEYRRLSILAKLTEDLPSQFKEAVKSGDSELVDLLIYLGVDPSIDDNYAMWYASKNGHDAVVARLLTDERVDPLNAGVKSGLWYQSLGSRPLCYAAFNGHLAVVALLLEARDQSGNSRFNATCCNLAFQWSFQNPAVPMEKRIAIMKLLLEARDDSGRMRVNPSNTDNFSLKLALYKGLTEVVELLKAYGCRE